MHKPHVIQYRRERKKELVDLLNTRVPLKLFALIDGENAAAAVRAALSLTELNNEAQAEPVRRIQTDGIVIVIGQDTRCPVPHNAPTLELAAVGEEQ